MMDIGPVWYLLILGQVLYKELDSAEPQMAIAAVRRLVNCSASSHVFVAPVDSLISIGRTNGLC